MPSSPYGLSKLAQELLGIDGNGAHRTSTIARAFNHFGPRQDPYFAASGFARRIAEIEAGRWEPEIVGRQPRRAPRSHRRARHRARLPDDRRTRPARAGLQRLLGHAPSPIRELLDMLLARARVPVAVQVDPARYRPNDMPLAARRSRAPARRARMDAGDPDRAHARRPARVLAQPDAMKVLVTGGTGYLGRAVVSALAARGHDLVIFARSASRSGLPGTAVDGDIRDRAAVERAAAGCDAISHSAALVSIWRRAPRGLRRGQRRRTAQRAGGRRRARHAARALHVVVRRAPAARPHRAARRERLSAHEGRRRPARRRSGARRQPAGPRLPRRRLRPGIVHRGQPRRPADCGSSASTGCRAWSDRSSRWSYAYVDDVAAGHCAALERGRDRRTVRARRRERAAARRLRDRAAAHRTAAAAAAFRFRSRICWAPRRSCASRCSAARR